MNFLPEKKKSQEIKYGEQSMYLDANTVETMDNMHLQLTDKEKSISKGILSMIPKWVQDFLIDILKKALKQENGKCMVMYIKQDESGKKKGKEIDEQVAVLILKYDPHQMKMDLEKKLADDYNKLQELTRRNKFLEPKYEAYLKIIQDNKYQEYLKTVNDGK